MKKINLKIKGMHCKSCERLIGDTLEDLGISNSKMNSQKGTAEIEFDENKVTVEKIKKAIVKEGYKID